MFKKVGTLAATGALSLSLMMGNVNAEPIQPIPHIDWMKDKQIIQGNEKGDLVLNQKVSLAETVTLFSRIQGVTDLEADPEIKHWASGALKWALDTGIVEDVKNPNKKLTSSELIELGTKAGLELELEESNTVTREMFFHSLGEAATTQITIGHTNDVHGHIEEDEYNKEFGYAKMATIIDEWKAESENFFLIDAGDTFQGTIFVNQTEGQSIIPILNALDYETMAAGNHEFDFGYEQLLNLVGQLEYPVISSNVVYEDGSEFLQPVKYAEIAGKTFAFIGFVTEDTPIVTHPDNVEGLSFKSPVEVAKEMVPQLKEEVDHVIAVSHVGLDVDREIAESVDGIDLIIGGHSHTPIETPELVNGTYIVQDWEYGKSLGRADLYYYNDELVAFSGGLKEYDPEVEADPEIAKMVSEVSEEIKEIMNVVITNSEVDLDGDRALVRSGETNVGNLITDVLVEKTQSISGYEADVAIMNSGGIRTQLSAGEITKLDLNTLLPFPNTLAVLDVTGEEIVAALEHGVSKVEEQSGQFPQISGMSFTYDSSQPAGERVIDVKVAGEEIDLTKTYKLATNDFVAVGGDGYEMFADNEVFDTGLTIYSVVEEYFMNEESINPQVEDRIVDTSKTEE
ncbi:bifunctional metallophosphatase/5'-nucleotidase [Chengkuizengella axinellae]|uniref:5'-nucleotidase C-terminal domain-containing protein n=1 Tax=Chengkuizengella axinellae TaxID=3064388 RepID=A0ABT9J2C8_9BACL|nr:5'-nucleotidase C-terminal domain-containing protein [Chengkuizengella sp. 2205SS18-9]MDP5275770.1 5'-nucleotidase C-terminal domain-containing protein [Chengkuizengella sp. 2205SS18-9]